MGNIHPQSQEREKNEKNAEKRDPAKVLIHEQLEFQGKHGAEAESVAETVAEDFPKLMKDISA